MKIAVLGAAGRTGRHVVEQSLSHGHAVTALVRNPAKLSDLSDPNLDVVTCEVMNPVDLGTRITGHEAIVSAIGATASGPTTACADSARSVVAAAQNAGVRRVLAVSVAAAHTAGDGPFTRFVVKPMLQRLMLRHVVADALRMEQIIRHSGLDWTFIRPPMLTDQPFTGTYRSRIDLNVKRGFRISRANLAHAILAALEDQSTHRTDVSVAT